MKALLILTLTTIALAGCEDSTCRSWYRLCIIQ